MGIPSYFAHIVRTYSSIIKQFNSKSIVIDNLYLDSNSIIYDAIKNIPYDKKDMNFENKVNKWICERLSYYINTINPIKSVFIAFDGVSPIAKLEQQRNRRYKSWYVADYLNTNIEMKENWDTTAITPGSKFMQKLTKNIKEYFKDNKIVTINSSDIPGEGEHKIFELIRENPTKHEDENTVIYGLDADLIMLCLIHLKISTNIYLFRETPHFITSINSNLQPDQLYVLDIYDLDIKLNQTMHNIPDKICTLDYIFLCFLLGNDFLPHFPALNIRTNGIQVILQCYNYLFNNNERLIKGGKIIWNNFRKLITELAKMEDQLCLKEMKGRDKLEKTLTLKYKDQFSEEALQSTPLTNRILEKYIDIGKEGWEQRYYKELFEVEINDMRKEQICINYLEGLEWNLKYYIKGCPNWEWHYKYNYPPLLKDLVRYIPQFDTDFIDPNNTMPVDPLVQLAYVLPRNSLYLLPNKLYELLIKEKEHLYKLDNRIITAYCRYLWESHIILPHININELINLVKRFKNIK